MIFVYKLSNNAIFFDAEIGMFSSDIDIINLDDVNFDEYDPKTIFYVRRMTWHKRLKQ